MKTALRLSYLFVLGTLISCKSTKSIQDPTLLHAPEPPLYDYSEMNYYGYNGVDSSFIVPNLETNEWEQYIIEETRYVVVTPLTYYLIRFENKQDENVQL
jgi:hypothetical protein